MPYEIRESVPDPETFVALRDAVDMAPRSLDAARRGLPNSLFGAIAVDEETGETVGMARVVGVHESIALVQPIRNAERF